MKRPCLVCGVPTKGSYCDAHRKPRNADANGRGYNWAWRIKRASIIADWVRMHNGYFCPGTKWCAIPNAPHRVAPIDLTVDHDNGLVMCRSANSRKGAGEDRMSNKPKGGNRIVRF